MVVAVPRLSVRSSERSSVLKRVPASFILAKSPRTRREMRKAGRELRVGHLCALIIALLASCTSAQERCVSPQNRNGQCINIRDCPALVDILRRRPLPPDALEFIRNSQCGFEGHNPKVCCESQPSVQQPTTVTEASPVTVPDNAAPPDVSNHPNLSLLRHDLCGPVTEQKIFGGNRTGVFDFPWMALIAYNTGSRSRVYRCGGTVINKRYILTAAHCVTSLPSGMTVSGARVGDHDISRERDCDRDASGFEVVCAERYQDFGIESVHFHPSYMNVKFTNDIALLRLDGDIDFRPQSVRPICLPIGTAATLSQKKVVVTGWGTTELGRGSEILLKVQLSPVSTEQCIAAYAGRAEIWHKQMCAGGKRSMDSCHGDSGGPLQAPGIYNNRVRYIQYGIVSFGPKSCGTEGLPGVYTKLIYYTDWILDTIRE